MLAHAEDEDAALGGRPPASASCDLAALAALAQQMVADIAATARSASVVSAAVTCSSGHKPVRSHRPISSACRRRARRSAGHQAGPLANRQLGQLADQRCVGRRRALLQQLAQHAGLGEQAVGQERAAGEHAADQLALATACQGAADEVGERWVGGGLRQLPPPLQPTLGRKRICDAGR